jgi:polygalacturonase
VLVGTPSIYDYVAINGMKALIVADGQQNIGVSGKGVIEGQGPAVLEQIAKQIQKGYLQETISQASPALIALNNCSGINIEGFNLQNACGNVIALTACKQVRLAGLKIKSTSNKETKGLVFSKVDGIKLENLFIETVQSEIKSDGLSTNISMVNCQYASGKKLIFKN